MNRKSVRWLSLILGVALGLRIALGLAHTFWYPDSADYDALGRAIVARQPYEVGGNVASRMPGYPVMVAAVYAVVGPSVKAVLVVQGLLGAMVVLLVYAIARRVGETVALVAAGLAAVDPLSVGFSAALLSEVPFTFLMMLALWLAIRSLEQRPRIGTWIGMGIAWGLAVYFRASALWCLIPLVTCLGIGAPRLSTWQRFAEPCLAVAIMLLVLTPWLVRNYSIFHSGPLRLTTLEGISLYESVYPGADGGPQQHLIKVPEDMRGLDEAERNDEWWRRGWQFVGDEPGRIARLAIIKLGRTWSPWFNAPEMRLWPIQLIMVTWHMLLFVLGLVGAVQNRAKWSGVLWIPVLYFTAVHALFLGSVRYRVPLMPMVCIFAAAGCLSLWKRWGKRSREMGV